MNDTNDDADTGIRPQRGLLPRDASSYSGRRCRVCRALRDELAAAHRKSVRARNALQVFLRELRLSGCRPDKILADLPKDVREALTEDQGKTLETMEKEIKMKIVEIMSNSNE